MPDPTGRLITAPPSLAGRLVLGSVVLGDRLWLVTDRAAASVRGARLAVAADRVTLAPLPEWQGLPPDYTGSEP